MSKDLALSSLEPSQRLTKIKWPVADTGRNSVRPSTKPSRAATSRLTRAPVAEAPRHGNSRFSRRGLRSKAAMPDELPDPDLAEWLEPDGLGGFASGTRSGLRTRRYHGLLLCSLRPPQDRRLLVQGFVAWLETEHGRAELWPQSYAGGY